MATLQRKVLQINVCTTLGMLSVLLPIHMAQGTDSGSHYYFVLVLLLVVMIFLVEAWRVTCAVAAVNLALFLFYALYSWPVNADFPLLSPDVLRAIQAMVVVTCIVTIFSMFLISERSAAVNERMWQTIATTDVLTNLPNRRAFSTALNRELSYPVRESHLLTMAMLDVDHFKSVNDTLGYEAGDAALSFFRLVFGSFCR